MTTRKQARDQIVGKTQAAGRAPSVNGIASRRLAGLVNRAMGVADAVSTILAARDSGDPVNAAIAAKLLANKEFVGAMIAAVEQIKSDVVATKAKPAAEPKTDDVGQVGPEHPESDPEAGSNLPGTDSAAMAPVSYTVAHLQRDIAIQNGAAVRIASQSNIGMDAARAKVNASPLVPSWDSPCWTPEARQYLRDRASYDGFAAAHIAKFGDLPTYQSEHNARRGMEAFMDRFGAAVEPQQHPRSFDR